MDKLDFVTLSCPTCGAKLEVVDDVDHFTCAHCGNEHAVRRHGGMVYLRPLIEGVERVQAGVDKTAAELAITRLQTKVNELEAELQRIQSTYELETSEPSPKERELLRLSALAGIGAVATFSFGFLIVASVFALAAIAFFVWVSVLSDSRYVAAKQRHADKVESVSNELRKQRTALAHNLAVVDS